MMSHEDMQHFEKPSLHEQEGTRQQRRFMARLRDRAFAAEQANAAQITGGIDPQEPVLDTWDKNGVRCVQRPDDEQGILRISVGGESDIIKDMNYCVFRGDRTRCAYLLEQAAKALRERIVL